MRLQVKTNRRQRAKLLRRLLRIVVRRFSNRIQYRLNVGRRAGDDAQDFARCSLLLQRFLELLKQPDILNGDDGLVGEVSSSLIWPG